MIRRKTGISFKSFLGGRVLRYPCVIESSHGDTEYGVIFPDLAAISKNPAWDGWVVTYVDTDLAHSNQGDAEPVI